MFALSETRCNLVTAAKLLLLRRLIDLTGVDSDHCKAALLTTNWDLERALDYLSDHNVEQDSPEIVHV